MMGCSCGQPPRKQKKMCSVSNDTCKGVYGRRRTAPSLVNWLLIGSLCHMAGWLFDLFFGQALHRFRRLPTCMADACFVPWLRGQLAHAPSGAAVSGCRASSWRCHARADSPPASTPQMATSALGLGAKVMNPHQPPSNKPMNSGLPVNWKAGPWAPGSSL